MKVFYSLVLITICVACTPSCDYPYRDNLDKFLAREINYTIPVAETILIFLPLDGCNPCLKGTIEMLVESNMRNFELVISTTDLQDVKKFNLDKLFITQSKIHYDLKNNYERYEIGVSAPMIFHFKNGKCVFHSETTDNRKPEIRKHFGWS